MKINKIAKYLKPIAVFFTLYFQIAYTYSHTVTTIITDSGLNGPDGFALDKKGNLFVANWGGGQGSTVLKITKGKAKQYISGLKAPDGLVFDKLGNLFISNYADGVINKKTPSGEVTVFAKGLNNPSAMVFDHQGNLYVSNHGGGRGTTVSKISPEGDITTYASGFDAPLGLAFDENNNLYVSNYNSGVVNKISSTQEVSVFAEIPNAPLARLQYLVFDNNENLYVPSYGHNKIYVISSTGEVSIFAGTGIAGSKDGPVNEAQFDGPNSIIIDKEDAIYISEYNANRIRKILN